MKRNTYLSWKDYFMNLAFLTSQRSKDPNTQVGSVIVDENNVIISIGYNGFPRGCSDDVFPWIKGTGLNNKYLYVCHAEINAVLNSKSSIKNCILYTTLFPCSDCTKYLIQSGIKKIYYFDKKHNLSTKASKKMLKAVGIKYKKVSMKSDIKGIQ